MCVLRILQTPENCILHLHLIHRPRWPPSAPLGPFSLSLSFPAARYDLLQCTVGQREGAKDTKNSRGEGGSSREFNFNVGLNHHRIQICFTVSYAKATSSSSPLLSLSWLLVPFVCPLFHFSLSCATLWSALTDKTADKRDLVQSDHMACWGGQ